MVLQSSKYLIAGEQINWVESLADYYAKRNAQEEKSLQEWQQHRAEKLKVSAEESPIKMLEKIAGLSSKVGTIVKAHQQSAAKKELAEQKVFEYEQSLDPNKPYLQEAAKLRYQIEKGDAIGKKSAQEGLDILIAGLKKRGNHEAAEAIENDSPRNIIWRNELWAREMLPKMNEDYMRRTWNQRNDTEAAARYDKASIDQKRALLKRFQVEELAFLNLKPEFFAAVMSDELGKQRSTAHNINKAKTYSQISNKTQRQFGIQLNAVKHLPDQFDARLMEERDKRLTDYQDIVDENGVVIKSKEQQANESIKSDLIALGNDNILSTTTLDHYLKHKFPHPAGKEGVGTPGSVFYNKQDIVDLVNAAEVGMGRAVGLARGAAENALPDLKRRALAGEDVSTEASLILNQFPELKDKVNDILETNPQAQSQTAEQLADAKYQKLFDEGILKPEDVKNEPNAAMNKKWTAKANQLLKFNSSQKYSEYEGGLKDGVTQYTRKRSLEPGQKQNNDEQLVTNMLQKYASKLKAEKLSNQEVTGKSDRTIMMEIQDEVEAWKIRNGWGTENGPGMFSIKANWASIGSTPSWPNLRRIAYKLEEIRAYDHKLGLGENLDAVYNETLSIYPDRDNRIKQVGGIYTKDMLLAYKENGYFNRDMKIIAAKNALLPGEAYELAVEALANGSDEDKNWLVAFNFEQGSKEAPPDVQVMDQLIQAAENTKGTSQEATIKQIQSIMKWYGFDHLNLAQRKQLYDILASVSPVTEGLTNPLEFRIQEMRAQGKTELEIKEFIENLQREKLSRERGLELQRGDVTNVNRNIT